MTLGKQVVWACQL